MALALIALPALTGCEELFFQPVPDNSPEAIFEQAWEFADREYSFFDYKGIDWQAKRAEYEPDIEPDMTEEELFDVLAAMLAELQDGHVNLRSDFDRSRSWDWFLDYDTNYDYTTLERNYFNDRQQYVGSSFILFDFKDYDPPDGSVLAQTMTDLSLNTLNVGYIHYRSFSNMIADDDLDYVIDRFKDHEGLIIDVRDNGGGAVANAYKLAGRLVTEKTKFGEAQHKNGPGHEDFSEREDLYVQPPLSRPTFGTDRPVVVLTNRLCYSSTNYFVAMVKELDHVTIMGDQTGGGGGIPSFTVLSNGWQLRVSSSLLYMWDETGQDFTFNVENGISPEEPRSVEEATLAAGTDTILEEAVTFIVKQ